MFAKRGISATERQSLLNCRRLPGRLTAGEAAAVLGFQDHDITILMEAKLLKPLGKPVPNAPKYFASSELVDLAQNGKWLDDATKAVTKHWQNKNNHKKASRMDANSARLRDELVAYPAKS